MKISYNPKTAAVITTATAANDDILFDLNARKVWAKGLRMGADWADISSKPSSLKNPAAITFKDVNGKVISYDGSAATDLTAGTYIAKLPYGFASFASGVTWGNTTGTSIASWNDSSGGSIDFRKDNPSSGKLSIKVDGRVYVNEGANPVLSAESNNDFWGMRTPDGGNDWIRTSDRGLLPYIQGNAGSGHSSLGTSSWYFSTAYIDKVYGSLKGNADTATTATKADNAENADKLDNWHKDNILWTGYITSSTAGLQSYWAKMYDITITSMIGDEVNITFLVSEGHGGHFSIFLLRIRQNGANGSGAYNLNVTLRELVGNLKDKIVAYYNNKTGNVLLWGNVKSLWGALNYTILKKTRRVSSDFNTLGTLTAADFSTVQTLPTTDYTKVTMSRVGLVLYAESASSSTLATKLQTPRTIWGQSFDGTANVSGSLSGVGHILFSADNTYNIGSNSAASKYIYTNWLGAKSGLKLELGANNSNFGLGLCIDTNLNVGIGTNTPSYKLHVNGTLGVNGITTFNINNPWLTPSVLLIGRLDDSKNASKAIIGITNGNLHIDAYHNKSLYFNYYNKGNIKFGYQTGSYYISEDGSYYSGTAASANNASTATKLTSSAGNAALPIYFSDGKPVSCIASSIFSNLSNSGNNISVTVAGLNRKLTVAYASNSDTVDGFHYNRFVYNITSSYNRNGPYYKKIASVNIANWTWASASLVLDIFSTGYSNSICYLGTVEITCGHWNNTDHDPSVTCRWILKVPNSKNQQVVAIKNLDTNTIDVYLLNDLWDCKIIFNVIYNNGFSILNVSLTDGGFVNLPTASDTIIHYIPSNPTYIGNATTATKLQTSRNLWGNSFDGTTDINGSIIFPNIGDTAISSKISWSSSTDGADIYYLTTAKDLGNLVLNVKDDTNAYILLALNGVFKSHFDVANSYWTGRSALADKWTTARTFTIGNTAKNVDGSGNVSWSLSEIGVRDTWRTVQVNGTSIGNNTLNLCGSTYIGLTNVNGKVTFSLVGSDTTANQAILSNGTANGWTLKTLNIDNWDTAYNFVSTITGTDTDDIINKWDEIVNFLADIKEDNTLNTLLSSKLSILLLAAKEILTTKTNNALFWVNTKGTASSITTGPFTDHPYALLSVTNYNLNAENNKFFYRSRLAFSSAGDIKVASCHHENEYKLDDVWYNVLTSKNSGISGSTIKLNGTSITVYSSSAADNRYVKKSGDTMTGALNFANNTWNQVGDDVAVGDCNEAGCLGIKATNTTYPGIAFFNNANAHLGNLTAYNGNIKYGAYSLRFLDNGNTSVSASTWTNPFSSYNSNAVADGQAICVWGQSSSLSNLAADSGDMSLWLKRINAKAATLNMVLDGEYYANGNLRLAHVSEIPTSLKNPHALTLKANGTILATYDGSSAKEANFTYANVGAASANHNHDNKYLRLDGSNTMTGQIKSSYSAGTWIGGCTNAILKATSDGYNSLICAPTKSGNICISAWTAEDNLNFGYAIKGKTENSFDTRMYWDAPNNNLHATAFTGHLYGTADNAVNSDTTDGVHLEWSGELGVNNYTWLAGWTNDGKKIKAVNKSLFATSGHTHDDRYVKKTGDTMSGVLTIDTPNFGALTIKRNDDTHGASIQFRGKSSVYGYIGLNNGTKDKLFLRWGSDTSKIYTILDTSSTYVSNGKGIINGTTITQVDNATNADKLDGYHASGLFTALSNSNRGISLTVGGTTKSLSNISVGDADTVDGYHATDGRTFKSNINWAANWGDLWSDGTNKHPWYGFDHRYANTGVYSTTLSDYFGLTLRTGGGNISMTNSGNVGIGLFDPIYKLLVAGNVCATSTVTSAGFKHSAVTKNADLYVLTADGGYTFLNLTSNELAHEFSKDITVTSEWTDIEDFYGGNLNFLTLPGTYIVLVYYTTNSANSMYEGYFSGIMSWYTETTNSNNADEIVLHRVGHSYANTIYLRTRESLKDDPHPYTKLQISANSDLKQHTYKFKFKRIC